MKPDTDLPAHRQVWLVSGYGYKTALTEAEIVNQLASTHEPLVGQEYGAIRVFQFTKPIQ